MGLEPTLTEYITGMVEVFRLVRDVLKDDGTAWLNIGDSYASDTKGSGGASPKQDTNKGARYEPVKFNHGMKAKDLMMVPARLAIALQDDGWYLRSDIIWHKPNPMPESVTDRPTSSHEHIFLLTKSARYYYDADAIAEPSSWNGESGTKNYRPGEGLGRIDAGMNSGGAQDTRNARNVWQIATAPFSGAHFAVFPPEIPRRCILAGTSEKGECPECGKAWVRVVELVGGVTTGRTAQNAETNKVRGVGRASYPTGALNSVTSDHVTKGWQPQCQCNAEPVPQTILDPFAGAGTTLLVADRLQRNAIGIELNPEYADMARKRIYNDAPLLMGMEL